MAERAGIVSGDAAPLTAVWYLTPLLCGVVLVGLALGRVRLAGITAATLSILVTTGAVLVARSPLLVEPGVVIGGVAGGSTMLAATAVVATAGKAGREHDRSVGPER